MLKSINHEQLSEYLNFANILADASGAILSNGFKDPICTTQKSDLSPVTQVDIEVEKCIRSLIEENFPEHGIIGEEFGNIRGNSPYQWVIDPIDGTKSFIAGYPIFTTLIALFYENEPILGIINQPILYERWAAITGQPTFRNNSPLPLLNNQKTLSQANIATTSTGYFNDKQENNFAKLRAATTNTILGGDAYAYVMLASGRLDIVVDVAMKPYDFCALSPIIEGVGGVISDWNGQPLTLSSDGNVIAAASKKLHEEALLILNK